MESIAGKKGIRMAAAVGLAVSSFLPLAPETSSSQSCAFSRHCPQRVAGMAGHFAPSGFLLLADYSRLHPFPLENLSMEVPRIDLPSTCSSKELRLFPKGSMKLLDMIFLLSLF